MIESRERVAIKFLQKKTDSTLQETRNELSLLG